MNSKPDKNQQFVYKVLEHYDREGRDLPWRQTDDPYKVMVSELMLQQTQVGRVIPKYEAFTAKFSNVESLASAQLADVLKLWSGLGYNRRAKYLHEAAKKLVVLPEFPRTIDELATLPGIGKNTAGAIVVYAFNEPAVFIETNVRTCLIAEFFESQEKVSDSELRTKLAELLKCVDTPREFYWGLMDFGTQLKKSSNNIQRSKHYSKQSPFAGSKRQVRGAVLKLLAKQHMTDLQITAAINDHRLGEVLADLQAEGLISKSQNHYCLG